VVGGKKYKFKPILRVLWLVEVPNKVGIHYSIIQENKICLKE